LAFSLEAQVSDGEVTINLRAETEPERLESAVRTAVAEMASASGITVTITQLERFRPGRPVPTHRMAATR
jgi:hypothetical protein